MYSGSTPSIHQVINQSITGMSLQVQFAADASYSTKTTDGIMGSTSGMVCFSTEVTAPVAICDSAHKIME